MVFVPPFRNVFQPPFASAGAKPSVPSWWLPSGIVAADCIAAYQPKGTVDYAASKINLVHPGTYDAIEGVAPSWSASYGWSFNGVDKYLDLGFPLDRPYSLFIQYTNAVSFGNNILVGIYDNYDGCYTVQAQWNVEMRNYWGDSYQNNASVMLNGNYGCANGQPYRNGIAEPLTVGGSGSISDSTIWIGGGHYYYYVNGTSILILATEFKCQAVVAYNKTLNPTQALELAASMAAL